MQIEKQRACIIKVVSLLLIELKLQFEVRVFSRTYLLG